LTHLDTSFLVDLLRESAADRPSAAHAALDGLADEELAVSVHVACELYAGAELSNNPGRERARVDALLNVLRVVHTGDRFGATYATLLAELRRRGEPVATMDLLIAAAARVDGAPLVTRNVRDFERVPGLDVRTY
jgi:tRNA(fMet)-specific endonuclease VapC